VVASTSPVLQNLDSLQSKTDDTVKLAMACVVTTITTTTTNITSRPTGRDKLCKELDDYMLEPNEL